MGTNEGIRDSVADVYVQTADIKDGVITKAKMAATVGTVHSGTLISASASGYVTLITVTSNATFYFGAVVVTAVGTSGGVSLCNSSGTAFINEIAISAAARNYANFDTAVNTTKILEISAGGTLCALYTTGTATSNFIAKYYVCCVNTP
jgi:hypothetical protein